MIIWDRTSVIQFLGVTPRRETISSPLDPPHDWFFFDLSFPKGGVSLAVVPEKEFCQIYHNNKYGAEALISAYISCTRIDVKLRPVEGDPCILFVGDSGHVSLSQDQDGIKFFFCLAMPANI